MRLPRLFLITDPSLPDDELVRRLEIALTAAPPGEVAVQIRDRERPARTLFGLVERVLEIARPLGAPVLVNDRIDVALATGASGVHLGERSALAGDARRLLGAEAVITVAAHDLAGVERAARAGATAVLLSPIFDSPGKGPPIGVPALRSAIAASPGVPVYALGGLAATNAASCREAGAAGGAVIRAVLAVDDPAAAVTSLLAALR